MFSLFKIFPLATRPIFSLNDHFDIAVINFRSQNYISNLVNPIDIYSNVLFHWLYTRYVSRWSSIHANPNARPVAVSSRNIYFSSYEKTKTTVAEKFTLKWKLMKSQNEPISVQRLTTPPHVSLVFVLATVEITIPCLTNGRCSKGNCVKCVCVCRSCDVTLFIAFYCRSSGLNTECVISLTFFGYIHSLCMHILVYASRTSVIHV